MESRLLMTPCRLLRSPGHPSTGQLAGSSPSDENSGSLTYPRFFYAVWERRAIARARLSDGADRAEAVDRATSQAGSRPISFAGQQTSRPRSICLGYPWSWQ